ncbi:hypothetical protein FUU19_07520 [Serratia sp. Lou2A]|uniref:Uncharacterized protein n=1 Tax=Serratia montpellierensis TaxID=2598730 RepID=A0ABS8J5T5_9GAMM|nr:MULTISPECIES: hypothetical protein [Serratia]MCC7583373.1 hypothetical protein [Serratia sp. Lou2A]MCC7659361.1 hypothetical protein [Serratia sp. Pon4B]
MKNNGVQYAREITPPATTAGSTESRSRLSWVVSFVQVSRPAAAAQEAIEHAGIALLTAGEEE